MAELCSARVGSGRRRNYCPPTTHLIATVDDLTDMLDFDSEDIDGMDDDAGEEQEPPPTGRWTATSSHDIYMVDTPKENNDEERKNAAKDNPLEKQPKRRRQRCRSKSCHSKNSDNDTRKNNTPDDSKGNDDPMDPAMEQDEPGDGEHSLGPLSDHSNAEGRTHQPFSREEKSPDDDAFIIPEGHLEQENLRRRLIATARSLKKQKQRLKAAQNTLNNRWNKVLDTEGKYGGSCHTKSYPKRKLLPEFDDEALEPT